MERYLVVAEKCELKLGYALSQMTRKVIVTGPGFVNVIQALKDIPRNSDILNVGYCGGYGFEIGDCLWIRSARQLHHRALFDEKVFKLDTMEYFCRPSREADCYTSSDFVQNIDGLVAPCVVDMELAAICALGFSKVSAIKYVSDNLNYNQYQETQK